MWFQLLLKASITMSYHSKYLLSSSCQNSYLLIIHGYPKLDNIISNKWLSKYPNITRNCIPSREKRNIRGIAFPQGKKWACIYSVKKNIHCSTNWRKFQSLYLIWTCYLLYPLKKFTIFEPLNCKYRELNRKERKEILLVWIVMNLENDRWKICMQISEENLLSL